MCRKLNGGHSCSSLHYRGPKLQRSQANHICRLDNIGLSDIPRDHCHGLTQSATRISGPDFTIIPAYCVVCRARAITGVWAREQQGDCRHTTVRLYTRRTQPVRPVCETSCCMKLQRSTLLGLVSFSRPIVARATQKKSCSEINRTTCFVSKGDFLMLYGASCAYVDLRDSAV